MRELRYKGFYYTLHCTRGKGWQWSCKGITMKIYHKTKAGATKGLQEFIDEFEHFLKSK